MGYFCWCIHVYTCVFEGDLLELVLGSCPLSGGPVNKTTSSYSLKWHQQECFASPEYVKQLTGNLASLLGILCILASGLSFCLLKTVCRHGDNCFVVGVELNYVCTFFYHCLSHTKHAITMGMSSLCAMERFPVSSNH